MGCVVDGPGLLSEADLGAFCGDGRKFRCCRVTAIMPEPEIVDALSEEALRLAQDTRTAAVEGAA
ncbi:hypothetical protein ACFXGI_02565 [Streptomyces sp. NPDC059355]|uniref:hypothetical protein n=1 Tax=Streptomyces sp. NPDC059355 TaxID=3346811 RepID=UPI0036B4F203